MHLSHSLPWLFQQLPGAKVAWLLLQSPTKSLPKSATCAAWSSTRFPQLYWLQHMKKPASVVREAPKTPLISPSSPWTTRQKLDLMQPASFPLCPRMQGQVQDLQLTMSQLEGRLMFCIQSPHLINIRFQMKCQDAELISSSESHQSDLTNR